METRTTFRNYAPVLKHPAVIVIGVLLLSFFNAGADYVNDRALHIPLFLDTIGTLLATVLLGVFPGVATAVGTHFFLELLNGPSGIYLPWMACSISSALILWWLIRRGAFETPLHALLATLWIALANAFIGALVAALFFTGDTGHAVDYVASALYALGQSVFSAAFLARLPVNVADKAIAVFVAYLAYRLTVERGSHSER